MANLFDPTWDLERDEPPYRWRRALLGRQSGARDLGASLFELPPGGHTFPLHAHLNNEELLIVIAGELVLDTGLAPERALAAGDVVACPAGPDGAHRLRNASGAPARVLIVSTMRAPDVNLFPEERELWVRDYAPGTEPPEQRIDVRTPWP
jgi:uncharacterized cupin superfamily protein